MSRIRLSGHAKRRIEERGIAVEAVIDTIFSPSHEFTIRRRIHSYMFQKNTDQLL